MAHSDTSQYRALMTKPRGDLERDLEIDDERREAIVHCLEDGDLRLILQDVDFSRLTSGGLGGGYLWD